MDEDYLLEDIVCPQCGEEKNPNFSLCYLCSMQEQDELDDWIKRVQIKTRLAKDQPF